jgi:hypothetical protein
VRLVAVEARDVDDAAATEKHLVDFRTELTEDLAGLCETYERNIQCLDGICSPHLEATPPLEDCIHWMTSEVGCLPEVFVTPRSEIAGMKPPYMCPGCFIHTYSNNMINRFHIQ